MGEFQWRAGSPFAKCDADRVGQEIVSILETDADPETGTISPHQVLAYARLRTDSALHQCFEWDDEKAAEAHRLDQARAVESNLLRVTVKMDGTQAWPRAFVNVSVRRIEDRKVVRGYMALGDAMKRPTAREYLIADALKRLEHWRQQYEQFSEEFAPVFAAIEMVKQPNAKGKARRRRA